MNEVDPSPNDPFFSLTGDPDWNACIGKQGEEENYIDGYIEAAIELVDAVIEKQMFGKRDTLVLPILYNARHSIELAMKFASDRLSEGGVIYMDARKRNHNIKAYWEWLQSSSIGDEKLNTTIAALEPFVESLSRIDSDGQELRYHRNRNNDPSLANYSLANLEVIQASLRDLQSLISDLQYRTVDFLSELATGSHTSRCSRRDLLAIAQLMPRRDMWNTQAFDDQKAVVSQRFDLSNRQFSAALDRIQENREMSAILGIETALLHISDEDIITVTEQWRQVHRKRERPAVGQVNPFAPERFEAIREHIAIVSGVVETLKEKLSPQMLADLEVMFYLGRDRVFPEYYERMVASKIREHAVANNPQEEIRHLMEKTNFLQCIKAAAVKLGRLSLAERLKDL